MNLTSLADQFAWIVLGALLSIPGIYALYRGMHRDLEEVNMRLQLESHASEIRRLQVLTDDQAREIARLRVKVAGLTAGQDGVMDVARRLSKQVVDLGGVPFIDVNKMGDILS